MSRVTSICKALCVASMTFALISAADASAVRTFISGAGNDSSTGSNCPRTSPCRTLAGAYGVTSSGGEIVMMDPAGYGGVTITMPLTIVGADGAAIAVSAASTGITINTGGANDVVVIRNVQIDGSNAANTTGISITKGRLVLRDVTLKLLTTGLSVSNTTVDVINTDIIGNTTGVTTTGTGTDPYTSQPTWGPTQVRLSHGNVINNTTAFFMNDPGLTAAAGSKNNKITIELAETGTTSPAITTNIAGNGTMVSGTGASCGYYQVMGSSTYDVYRCISVYDYIDNTNNAGGQPTNGGT